MFSRHVSHVSPCQDSPLCLLQPRQRARGGAGAAGRGARREVRGAEQARAGQLVSPGGQVREAVNHISQNFHNIRKGPFCPSLPSYRMSLLRTTVMLKPVRTLLAFSEYREDFANFRRHRQLY